MDTEYQGVRYEGINSSTTEINQNFKIKVSGIDNGKKIHSLVGVSGLIKIVGDTELVNSMLDKAFNKMLDKAFNKMLDKVERKLRRGLKITFYTY